MSLFENQLKQREKSDNDMFEESFINVIDSVVGKKTAQLLSDSRIITNNEIDSILKYFHIKTDYDYSRIEAKNLDEKLEYLLRPHNIMRRTIELKKGWYKDSVGALLGTRKDDGSIVAFIPRKLSGYVFFDSHKMEYQKVSKANKDFFNLEAIAFYKPFPLEKLGISGILHFIKSNLNLSDIIYYLCLVIFSTALGYLLPQLNYKLFGEVISIGTNSALLSIGFFILCTSISLTFINCAQQLMISKITLRMNFLAESATFMRVLSLPTSFFRNYSSGELASRVTCVTSLVENVMTLLLTTSLTAIFSLVYLTQIFRFAPALVVPSISVCFITIVIFITTTIVQSKITEKQMDLNSYEFGMSFGILSGIQKIKLAGAEKRAYARWAKQYSKVAKLKYNPPMFLKINDVLILSVSLIGNIVLFYAAMISKVSIAEYYGFTTAYAMISGAFTALGGTTLQLSTVIPTLNMVRPIFEEAPEITKTKKIVEKLKGNIKLDHISFKYYDNAPYIFEDFSLNIQSGQYIAVVGKTGCGKSTLVRLLLGFEQPEKGAIYYDNKDLQDLDQKSLRSHIGSVLQDGKLMRGDILSNILLVSPNLSLDAAWEAAEIAGIAEDIKEMPLGMQTLVLEGQGGISGGQKQRLLIARAIAPKPEILILDEATSALDNITQMKVSNALEQLNCTRIIIAHRLSTIKQCDRIIVIDDGRIVEDGTYDELIKNQGLFTDLVRKQQIEE